ncbi:hypothetical protein SDC9_209508 [bioreactor metagenome]|uniref:Uncharacterized protein n=1 Tax=bioreactor metagenome TaxID=1076179 RepID=A0A645JE81_9ZZZZ
MDLIWDQIAAASAEEFGKKIVFTAGAALSAASRWRYCRLHHCPQFSFSGGKAPESGTKGDFFIDLPSELHPGPVRSGKAGRFRIVIAEIAKDGIGYFHFRITDLSYVGSLCDIELQG